MNTESLKLSDYYKESGIGWSATYGGLATEQLLPTVCTKCKEHSY